MAMAAGAQMQTGVVVEFSPHGLFVAPGGADAPAVNAGYLRSMYQPVLGETVALINQGASWLCLGAIQGPMDTYNMIPNYSFEDSAPGVAPDRWTVVNTTGAATLTTVRWTHPEFVHSGQVAGVNANAAGTVTTTIRSDGVPVEAGQGWGFGAYYRPKIDFGANAGTIRLYASWYSASDTASLISEYSTGTYPLVRGHGWRLMTESGPSGRGVVAPPASMFLRVKVVLSWTALSTDVVYLDRVTARRTV